MTNLMCLQWKNLTYSVPSQKRRTFKFWSCYGDQDNVEVLNNISGCVNTGELVAVLGPSGSGKTTMLAAISQRLRGVISGEVCLNGQPIRPKQMPSVSSYVPQFNIPVNGLTSFEYLVFMCHFKMDKSTTRQFTMQKVKSVLFKVGLKDVHNTQVRQLSGGERKRLSLAEELLTDPPFLFCDEPTTGLDSFNAHSVVFALRQLTTSRSGAVASYDTCGSIEMEVIPQSEIWLPSHSFEEVPQRAGIMCSIHQPTSDVFELFTHVLLLESGRIVFYGSTDDACLFFSKLGLFCPLNCNPAEFYVKLLTKAEGGKNFAGIIQNNFEQEVPKSCYVQALDSAINGVTCETSKRISWMCQVYLLLCKGCIEARRTTKKELASSYVFIMLTSMVISVVYSSVPGITQLSVQNILGCFFIVSTELVFTFSYGATYLFPSQLSSLRRYIGENTYHLSAFYVAEVLLSISKAIITSFVFFGPIYASVNFSRGPMIYLKISSTLSLAALVGIAYGTFLSSIYESEKMSAEMAAPLDTLFMIFGGVYLGVDTVPYIKYTSMFYYTNEAIAYEFWNDIRYIECPQNASCLQNGTEVLDKYSFHTHPNTLIFDYVGLVALAIIFHIIAFLGIRRLVNRAGYY